jgi:hypothetical protein
MWVMLARPMQVAKLFISYAHEDETYRNELVKHLRLLERGRMVELWHDRKIGPGGDWASAIQQQLTSANIVLLLISSDFINSDYCYGVEMPAALKAAENGTATVVPVLIRNTAFAGAPFAKFQMLPRECRPVEEFDHRDKAWSEIATAIGELAGDLSRKFVAPVNNQLDAGPAPATNDWNRLREAMLSRLQLFDRTDDWLDRRFTELAAEVESEGGVRKQRWRWRAHGDRQLRRVPSLRLALESTTDRLSLVVGEPGAGKSVSMRVLARQLLRGETPAGQHAILPLYVNLRGFCHRGDGDVTAADIAAFVLQSVCQGTSERSAAFFREHFEWALRIGRLLILLDSFDETPEILSSGEPDATVTKYAEAIQNFANGMHSSRVVVASRPYRGPGRMRWPQFRILPLGEERRREFIRAWFDNQAVADAVLSELVQAEGLDGWIENPLLLALLCAYRKEHRTLPRSAHDAFESFVQSRIAGRPDILQEHRLTPEELRESTEQVAFAMNADSALGLAPNLSDLVEAMRRRGKPESVVVAVIACLADLQLGRASRDEATKHQVFAFFHRRVQEYFCTCLALRTPEQLDVSELLSNERWRETAVTLLQTARHERVRPLLQEADRRLQRHDEEIQRQTHLPLRDLRRDDVKPADINKLRSLHGPREFPWPKGLIHLLGIFSDFRVSGSSPELIQLRRRVDACVLSSLALGLRFDQATALHMSNAMSTAGRRCALAWAFRSESGWLEDIAFERTGHLTQLPPVIVARVGAMLALKERSGDLRRERSRIEAQIRRVEPRAHLLKTFQLLRSIRLVDFSLLALMVSPLAIIAALESRPILGIFSAASIAAILYWLGSRFVQRNASRTWQSEVQGREELLPIGLFGSLPVVCRALLLGTALVSTLPIGPISRNALTVFGVFVAVLLTAGYRPGIYCGAIAARLPRSTWLPFVGGLPMVLVVQGLWSRLGIIALILGLSGPVLGVLFFMAGKLSTEGAEFIGKIDDDTLRTVVVSTITTYAVIGFVLTRRAQQALLDRWRLRRIRKQPTSRTVVGMLEEAGTFRRDLWRARYFRWIREQQQLAATPSSERVLTQFLLAIEQKTPITCLTAEDPHDEPQAADIKRWLISYTESDERRLQEWTRSVDEIAQLVDLLRAQLGQ